MIDHVTLHVADAEASRAFYDKVLAPLGYAVAHSWPEGAGYGTEEGGPDFWIRREGAPGAPVHVALRAKGRAAVRAFHAAALAAGGRDNGAPGLREHYGPTYYAAFVIDPDGNNLEAVCHEPS